MRIDEETKDIQRSLAFQISFVLGTILLYSAIIMALWWVAAIRACYQTSSWEVLVRSVIFGGVLFALFEVPYRSFPLLMPWFKDSVLIVAYWVLFGIAIDRPRGRQRLSEFRSWLVTVLILGIGLVLILFSLRVCATMLMPCITSAFIAATLFKLDADRAGSRGPG